MLKKRIIANLIINNGQVVQSIGFKKYLPIGKPEISVEFLNKWGIDEIIISDITATKYNTEINFQTYKNISLKSNVPLTIGGGIKTIDQIRKLLSYGADKIFINSYALLNPDFILNAAHIFGNQCIIVAIDVYKDEDGKYKIYNYLKKDFYKIDLFNWIDQLVSLGAGEILINYVNNDGKYNGFDVRLAEIISNQVNVPIIICGGAGTPSHFYEVLSKTNVAAAAAGNYFHFTENSVSTTKAYLLKKNCNIRLETFASYNNNIVDEFNRLGKFDDNYLENLLYTIIPEEKI
jgi:cyclase